MISGMWKYLETAAGSLSSTTHSHEILSGCSVPVVFVGLVIGVCLQSWPTIPGTALYHLRVGLMVSNPKGFLRACGDSGWLNQGWLDLATEAGVIHKLSLRAASTAPWCWSNSSCKKMSKASQGDD